MEKVILIACEKNEKKSGASLVFKLMTKQKRSCSFGTASFLWLNLLEEDTLRQMITCLN